MPNQKHEIKLLGTGHCQVTSKEKLDFIRQVVIKTEYSPIDITSYESREVTEIIKHAHENLLTELDRYCQSLAPTEKNA